MKTLEERIWALMPEWIQTHTLSRMADPGVNGEDNYESVHVREPDVNKAHIVLSHDGATGLHRPVLDIDFPIHVEPSSTEGHFHLYLDKAMPWDQYARFLSALADAGIIERQYASVSRERGYTSVRLPWIRKRKS